MGIDDILLNLTDLHQYLGFSSTRHFLTEHNQKVISMKMGIYIIIHSYHKSI